MTRPKEKIDPSQAWFWKRGWHEGELEASTELAAGEGKIHESDAAFLSALEQNSGTASPKGEQ